MSALENGDRSNETWHKTSWLLVAGWLLGQSMMAPPAAADSFTLDDGVLLEGSIMRAIGNTVSIRLESGGMYQCPIRSILSVKIIDLEGTVTEGRLLSWSDGAYALETPEGMVVIKDRQIIKQATQPRQAQPAPDDDTPTMPPSSRSKMAPFATDMEVPDPPEAASRESSEPSGNVGGFGRRPTM